MTPITACGTTFIDVVRYQAQYILNESANFCLHCIQKPFVISGKMPQTSKHKSAFDLQECARKNILALQPYRCARE